MFSLLKSVVDLTSDVVKVVTTPIEMTIDLVDAAVKPITEIAEDLKQDIKSLKD